MPDPRAAARHEHNVCGVLVQARPERAGDVRRSVLALPGVEVHRAAADGRLVVTVEDTPESLAAETLSRIHVTEGVLGAALVYHHCDRADAAPCALEEV